MDIDWASAFEELENVYASISQVGDLPIQEAEQVGELPILEAEQVGELPIQEAWQEDVDDLDLPQAMDIEEEEKPFDGPPPIGELYEIGECERAQRQVEKDQVVFPIPIRYAGPVNVADITPLMNCMMRRWIIIYPSDIQKGCPGLMLWDPLFEYTEALCERGDNVTAMLNLLVSNVSQEDTKRFVLFSGPTAVAGYLYGKKANWKEVNKFNLRSLREQTKSMKVRKSKWSGRIVDFTGGAIENVFSIDPRVTGLSEEKRRILREYFIDTYVGKAKRSGLKQKTPQELATYGFSRKSPFDFLVQGCGGIMCAFEPMQKYNKELKLAPTFCNLHSRKWRWEGAKLLEMTRELHDLLETNDALKSTYETRVTKIRGWSGDDEPECEKPLKSKEETTKVPTTKKSKVTQVAPLIEEEAPPPLTRQERENLLAEWEKEEEEEEERPRKTSKAPLNVEQQSIEERQEQRFRPFVPPPPCVEAIYRAFTNVFHQRVDIKAFERWSKALRKINDASNTGVYDIWNKIEKIYDPSERAGYLSKEQAVCLIDWLDQMFRDDGDVQLVAHLLFPQSHEIIDQVLFEIE